MSITVTAVATATPEPLAHPFWCHRQRCLNVEGESAIHRHIVGAVAGIEVVVERIDDYDASYRPRTGKVEVNLFTLSEQGMSAGQVGDLTTLLDVAALFAVEVSR